MLWPSCLTLIIIIIIIIAIFIVITTTTIIFGIWCVMAEPSLSNLKTGNDLLLLFSLLYIVGCVSYSMLQYGNFWCSMVLYGMVWYGMVWLVLRWYGTHCVPLHISFIFAPSLIWKQGSAIVRGGPRGGG